MTEKQRKDKLTEIDKEIVTHKLALSDLQEERENAVAYIQQRDQAIQARRARKNQLLQHKELLESGKDLPPEASDTDDKAKEIVDKAAADAAAVTGKKKTKHA